MIPVLETERLFLREGRELDFEPFAAFYADEEASKSVGGPLTRAAAWGRVAFNRGHWAIRGFGNWALVEKETGDYAGWCGLWFPEGFPEREVGWGLISSKRSRGYATETALRKGLRLRNSWLGDGNQPHRGGQCSIHPRRRTPRRDLRALHAIRGNGVRRLSPSLRAKPRLFSQRNSLKGKNSCH